MKQIIALSMLFGILIGASNGFAEDRAVFTDQSYGIIRFGIKSVEVGKKLAENAKGHTGDQGGEFGKLMANQQPKINKNSQNFLSNAWKELYEHPIETIAALFAIAIGLIVLTKKGRSLIKLVINWIVKKARPPVPTQTLRIVSDFHGNWWHMGMAYDEPAMQIVTRLHVTNIIDKPVEILSAIIKPTNTKGSVVIRHPKENVYGSFPVLPGATTEVDVNFWIQPPVKKEGKDLNATIVLIDQYGNRHKAKNIVYISDAKMRPKKEESKVPIENLFSIADPVEKNVVSVLKHEVNRYKDCGRRVGGLGSVHTIYEGITYNGIPTEWREAHSHKRQDIVSDTSKVTIDSDNLKAIGRIFEEATSEEAKTLIVNALLNRMNKETEYAPIGYFILLVAFRHGFLKQALQASKDKLLGDSKYGFGEILRLLDGLLRLKHTEFCDLDLDEIERFLNGISEDTFRINERIFAIRSYRLERNG